LLDAVAGIEIERLTSECCGFGGVFAVDQVELSEEMLKRRIAQIEEMGVETVVGCDVSCLMQIEGGLRHKGSRVRCAHIAQLLSERMVGLR
jgi:L-lactate dehydrogenase complex protein LldE